MLDINTLRFEVQLNKMDNSQLVLSPLVVEDLLDRIETAEKERDALRAKIEGMERQAPVAWCATDETGTVVEALGMNQSRRFDTALYLAPGAQPAPSVPEGWKLVPLEPTYEMLEAGEGALVPTYTDTPVSVPFDVYRAMLAAAPEAKPCP